MSDFHIVNQYPYPIDLVWRALTDPELVPRWTSTGRGGRLEGFLPVAGTSFKLVAKPVPGWNGIVECKVLEVDAPTLLRYSWMGDENGDVTEVAYRLAEHAGGTRFVWDHTGFTGMGGFLMSRLLQSVRKKMLAVALPALLAEIQGTSAD